MELSKTYSVIVEDTRNITGDEWLEVRKSGIGGSDAAAVCGLDLRRSPGDVWAEKVGLVERSPAGEPAEWGHRLEEPVARKFADVTGLRVEDPHTLMASVDNTFMLANIDRFVYGEDADPVGVLDCKTTSARGEWRWSDGNAPANGVLQIQHYQYVTGVQEGWLAVLIGGQKFLIVPVERDDALIESLIEVERKFWQHVVSGTPPDMERAASIAETITRRWAHSKPNAAESTVDSIRASGLRGDDE